MGRVKNHLIEYTEQVIGNLSNEFFNENETWLLDETIEFDVWIEKLCFQEQENPIKAAEIIERGFSLFLAKSYA